MNRNGRIDASSAAAFLKKSQLGDPVLHKVSVCVCTLSFLFIQVCVKMPLRLMFHVWLMEKGMAKVCTCKLIATFIMYI